MSKNTQVFETATLHLTQCRDGLWLWDETRQMNLSMRAATERDAFVNAIEYYQNRLLEVESAYRALSKQVDLFVEAVRPEELT